jgi:membrane associated rhomboid family serine protease
MNDYRPSFLNSISPVVKNIIALNLIFWLAATLLPNIVGRIGIELDLDQLLGMHYWGSEKFKLFQFFSYMFMHGNFQHLFFNMFSLYMFGSMLENLWGPKRFLLYYMVTGVGAGVIQQLFWTIEFNETLSAFNTAIATNSGQLLEDHQSVLSGYFRVSDYSLLTRPEIIQLKKLFMSLPVTVGASGAIFGLLLAFGWSFPETSLYIMFIPIPIKAKIFVFIYGAVELFFGVARFSGDNIAHFAHLGGMLFGIALLLYWKKRNLF